ncbi:acetyl-CoA carboxylase biotin carboxyl carrier protein [Sphaerisporangium dianthi]|uniref:Biotin carboxyl carrier protein of acetyl-CoA carboxylase n=1 Tax=Sphaerisporangium dianthi TaxID=1436120 RepID=A0ABV9CJL7_9ACTN
MSDPSTSGAPPEGPAAAPGDAGALATLCERLTGILDATRDRPVAHLRLAFAGAEVELAWAAEAPQGLPAALPPGAAAGPDGHAASLGHTPPDRSAVPAHAPADAPPGPPGHRITAPLVGTFYAAPAPGEKPFARVGDHVVAGQQLAVLEAMKLMNGIDADVTGVVAEICVDDGTPVEYGQSLFVITPETA